MSDTGHGHSTAAWTGVGLLLVASTLVGVGIMLELSWAIWVGAVLVLVGCLAWYGLHAAGYGKEWESSKH